MTTNFWTDASVRAALDLSGSSERSYGSISTDTRAIGTDDLFLALVGDRFDGHEFIEGAVTAGATGVVVSRTDIEIPEGVVVYRVDDTLTALHRLANFRRNAHPARFIGIVGSNGKTTTKELVRSVLSARYRTHATAANLNNQIGVPQTILGLPEDTEMAVIEMGTDRPGEIAILTEVVNPDVIVITSIGEEHLELLGNLEGVLEEEISVLAGLKAEGTVLVAEEPVELARRARDEIGAEHVRVAGFGSEADLRPDTGLDSIEVQEDGSTRWEWRGNRVYLPIPGKINVRNALLALGVGLEMDVPAADAVAALEGVKLPGLRGQWVQHGAMRVLADCYNANPPSVNAVIELLGNLPVKGRRIAVLGTMRELGKASADLHEGSADHAARLAGKGIDLIVATGAFAEAFGKHRESLGDHLVICEDTVEAYDRVRDRLEATDTILLKASRGDQMERWLPLLERDFGTNEGAGE